MAVPGWKVNEAEARLDSGQGFGRWPNTDKVIRTLISPLLVLDNEVSGLLVSAPKGQ